MSDIHTTSATINDYQVEYDTKMFDCTPCITWEKEKLELGVNSDKCDKCQCQANFDVLDASRSSKVKTFRGEEFNCANCDEEKYTLEFCTNRGFLKNDPEMNITDCSNNMVVTGENNTIEDVNMRTECNIDGGDNSNPPIIQEDEYNPQEDKKKPKQGGGGMNGSLLLLIAIVGIVMMMINKKK